MIPITGKRIPKWSYWRQRGIFHYCVTFGSGASLVAFFVFLTLQLLHQTEAPLRHSVVMALWVFVPATFLCIPSWFENQRRYKAWKEKKEEVAQPLAD